MERLIEFAQRPTLQALGAISDDGEGYLPLCDVVARFGLDPEDAAVLALLEGGLMASLGYGGSPTDVATTTPTVGAVCSRLERAGVCAYGEALGRFGGRAPLVSAALIAIYQPGHAGGLQNVEFRQVSIPDAVHRFLRGDPNGEGACMIDDSTGPYARAVSCRNASIPRRGPLTAAARTRTFPIVVTAPTRGDIEQNSRSLAAMIGKDLIAVDTEAMAEMHADGYYAHASLFRDAVLSNSMLYIDSGPGGIKSLGAIWRILAEKYADTVPVVFGHAPAGSAAVGLKKSDRTILPEQYRAMPCIDIRSPDAAGRLKIWRESFGDRYAPEESDLKSVAGLYALSEAQIAAAAAASKRIARMSGRKAPSASDLSAACAAHMPASDMPKEGALMDAEKYASCGLVLDDLRRTKFGEIMMSAKSLREMRESWGLGDAGDSGGTSVFMYGEPGTGKTTAAATIASRLNVELHRCDLARLPNMTQTDAEAMIESVFAQSSGNAVLLFDHAEILTARPDSYDTLFLLRKIDTYPGVAILRTDRDDTPADFLREHVKYIMFFPRPDEDARTELFKAMIPPKAPKRDDIDYSLLGEFFELTGGQIRRAVNKAALSARADKAAISLAYLVRGAQSVCADMGMLTNENLPHPLTDALLAEKDLPPLSEEEYRRRHRPKLSRDLPLSDLPDGVPLSQFRRRR